MRLQSATHLALAALLLASSSAATDAHHRYNSPMRSLRRLHDDDRDRSNSDRTIHTGMTAIGEAATAVAATTAPRSGNAFTFSDVDSNAFAAAQVRGNAYAMRPSLSESHAAARPSASFRGASAANAGANPKQTAVTPVSTHAPSNGRTPTLGDSSVAGHPIAKTPPPTSSNSSSSSGPTQSNSASPVPTAVPIGDSPAAAHPISKTPVPTSAVDDDITPVPVSDGTNDDTDDAITTDDRSSSSGDTDDTNNNGIDDDGDDDTSSDNDDEPDNDTDTQVDGVGQSTDISAGNNNDDVKQSVAATPSPSISLGDSQVAGHPIIKTPTLMPTSATYETPAPAASSGDDSKSGDDSADATQSEPTTLSPTPSPSTSLGDSQVAGHPVTKTQSPVNGGNSPKQSYR